jgi:hypothetical protein
MRQHCNYMTNEMLQSTTTTTIQELKKMRHDSLLENLSISNRFAVDRFVPSPSITNKFLITLTFRIQFLEIITLPIWCNIKSSQMIISSYEECTTNSSIIILAENK